MTTREQAERVRLDILQRHGLSPQGIRSAALRYTQRDGYSVWLTVAPGYSTEHIPFSQRGVMVMVDD